MRNVLNWTVGSFFRTIGRIIAYLIIGAIVALAFTYKPKAATLTSKTPYQEGYWYLGDYQTLGNNNTYSYSLAPLSVNGRFYTYVGSVGSTISGKAYSLGFGFDYNLNAQSYYDITFNFRSRDLTNAVDITSVLLATGSQLVDNDLSLIGVNNSATNGNNTNKLVVRVYALQPISKFVVMLIKDPDNITSVNNFGISSITIDEVDLSGTDEIINNQTNNTQNIINNQNNTTQQIIDNQNELLGSKCPNLFDSTNLTLGDITGAYSSIRASSRQDIYLPAGTYYFSTNMINYQYAITINDVNHPPLSAYPQYVYDSGWQTSNTKTFTISRAGWFVLAFKKSDNSQVSLEDIKSFNYMLSDKNVSYCKYGSYSSKLDDVNTSINDLNSSINDDDTSSAENQASSFFSNFTTNTHGLTSIITAPLSAIQSITSATCSPLVLPIPFVNQNLSLPCMRQIYVDNFGGFMTLYDTITFGIIAYWVLVRIFTLVKDFKNPEHDEIEVMDL